MILRGPKESLLAVIVFDNWVLKRDMVKSGPNRNLNYGVFVFSRLLASNDHLSRNIFGSTPENLSTGLCYT